MPVTSDLEFHGIRKAFGRNSVLRGVDLAIPGGSFVALMGANGAGKTTLLRLAAGLAVPTSGTVTLAGVDLRKAGPGLRRMIGWVSHESMLYADLSGRDNLMFHSRLFGVANPQARINELADALDLHRVLDRPAGVLSRGNRQRLTLARALLHGPDVLLLDEPFTGLDEASSTRLVGLLNDLHDHGRTIILTVHEISRAYEGAERLVVIENGVVGTDRVLTAESAAVFAMPSLHGELMRTSTVEAVEGSENVSTTSTVVTADRPSDNFGGSAATPTAASSEPAPLHDRPTLIKPPSYFRAAMQIASKDLRVEWRSRDMLGSAGLFSLIVLITASFTTPAGGGKEGVTTGILWIALLFAVLLGVGRSMGRESHDRAIEGLMLAPVPRESVYIGKLIAGLSMMFVIELFIVPMFLVLVNSSDGVAHPAALIATVVLATTGLVLVATLFSGIAAGSRLGDSLLPLIVMPVVIPLMVAAVETTRRALGGGVAAGAVGVPMWLGLLAGFDLIVGLAAIATFPFVMEEQ
jgi:heme exporter protein A